MRFLDLIYYLHKFGRLVVVLMHAQLSFTPNSLDCQQGIQSNRRFIHSIRFTCNFQQSSTTVFDLSALRPKTIVMANDVSSTTAVLNSRSSSSAFREWVPLLEQSSRQSTNSLLFRMEATEALTNRKCPKTQSTRDYKHATYDMQYNAC